MQTLGAANRALILASEETSLIQEMCAVVTEAGGYPWHGWHCVIVGTPGSAGR